MFRTPWNYHRPRRVYPRPQGKTPTSVTPVYPSYVPHFEKTRNNTNRRLLTPTLDVYPVTETSLRGAGQHDAPLVRAVRSRKALRVVPVLDAPLQASAAVPPGYFLPQQFKRTGWRKTFPLVHPPSTPLEVAETADIPSVPRVTRRKGFRRLLNVPLVPGIDARTLTVEPAALQTFKVKRDRLGRQLLTLPELNERPQTPVSTSIPLPLPTVNRRKAPKPDFEIVGVLLSNKSAATPSAFLVSPFQAIRRHTPRRHLRVLDVLGVDSQDSSPWASSREIKVEEYLVPSRRALRVAPVAEYLRKKFTEGATQRARFIRTESTPRRLLSPQPINVYPQTPKSAEGYPAPFAVPLIRTQATHRERQLLQVSIYRGYPTPPVITEAVTYVTRFCTSLTVSGEMSNGIYLQGEISDGVILVTPPFNQDLLDYLGQITDTINVKGDF